jgi:hypothetical protein
MSVSASSVIATSENVNVRGASLTYPGWPGPARGFLVSDTVQNKLYFIQLLGGPNLGNDIAQVALDNYEMFSDTNALLVVCGSDILHSRIVSDTPLRRNDIDDILHQYQGSSVYVASALYM